MTVTSAPAATPAPPSTATSRQRLFRYFIFALCASLYLFPFMRVFLPGTDEGTLVYGAVRIAHGEVLARDFFEVIGPGTFYWVAAFFKLFGISFLATRMCLFTTSLGTALLMYLLSRRICARYQSLPILLLGSTYFGGVWPGISHHVDSNFFALAAVACIVLSLDGCRRSLLLIAGALAGLTTLTLQPKGLLLFCSFAVWLFIQHRRRGTSLSMLSLVTGGYLGTIGVALLYFWSKGALGQLILDNYVWPYRHYGSVNSVPYAHDLVWYYWNHWIINKTGFRWTIAMATILIVPPLFVAALPGLLLGLGARYRWAVSRPEILLYWLCGGAMWFGEFHRKDMAHLVFGSPLLIILCVHFLSRYSGKAADSAIQVLSIGAVSLAAFNLCCLLLAAHNVRTRVGSIEMLNSDPAIAFLDEHAAPGEEIFAYPYCSQYYFLSATVNPTPYSILVYNYNTKSQFQEVVRLLEHHKIKYVVWNFGFVADTVNVFPSASWQPAGGTIVEPYLEAKYKPVWEKDGIRIMERISDAPTH